MRIASPPITHSCFYGVDTPGRKELLASQKTLEGIRAEIDADSLGFLSVDGLRKVLKDSEDKRYCYACYYR